MGTNAARDRSARARLAGTVLAGALALAACASVDGRAPALASGIDRASFDPSVRAQDDFFRAVNGAWLKKTPIPPDKSRIGAFAGISEKTEAQLRALVEEAARTRSDADARASATSTRASWTRPRSSAPAGAARRRAGGDRRAASVDTLGAAMRPPRPDSASTCRSATGINLDAATRARYVPSLGQGGLACPTATTTLSTATSSFAQARAALRRVPRAAAVALGHRRRRGDAGRRRGRARDRARAGPVDAGREPRSGQDLQPACRARRARVAGARLRLGRLARRRPASPARTSEIVVRQPSYLHAPSRRWSRATPLPAWKAYLRAAPARRLRALPAPRPSSTRASPSSARRCAARSRTKPRWKRGVALVQQSIGRGARQALRRALLPAGSQGADGAAGRQPARRLSREHRRARLDERRRPSEEAQAKLATFTAEDRLSGPLARLLRRSRSARDDLLGNVDARARLRGRRASSPSSASRSTATSGA